MLTSRSHFESHLVCGSGNEIGMRHTPQGAALARNLSAAVRSLDDGGGGSRRAVTSAYPGPGADAATDAFLDPLDVAGYNYAQVRLPARPNSGRPIPELPPSDCRPMFESPAMNSGPTIATTRGYRRA